jgi:hypothetical protein
MKHFVTYFSHGLRLLRRISCLEGENEGWLWLRNPPNFFKSKLPCVLSTQINTRSGTPDSWTQVLKIQPNKGALTYFDQIRRRDQKKLFQTLEGCVLLPPQRSMRYITFFFPRGSWREKMLCRRRRRGWCVLLNLSEWRAKALNFHFALARAVTVLNATWAWRGV